VVGGLDGFGWNVRHAADFPIERRRARLSKNRKREILECFVGLLRLLWS
jgi:hypothetical protein